MHVICTYIIILILFADPNIRVACLTCLGSMASVQAPMIEVLHLLQTPHPPTRFSEASGLPQSFTDPLSTRSDSQSSQKLSESGYQSNNSGEVNSGLSPGVPTPVLSSGAQTPSMSEKTTYGHGGDLSWLVKLCVRNVAPHLLETPTADAEAVVGVRVVEGQGQIHPLPVRLESLQDLAVLAKNYFPLLRYGFLNVALTTTSHFILRAKIKYRLIFHVKNTSSTLRTKFHSCCKRVVYVGKVKPIRNNIVLDWFELLCVF